MLYKVNIAPLQQTLYKLQKAVTKVKNKQVRVISGPKSRKSKETPEPKPWGWKNQGGKKFTSQSKRDPYYDDQKEEKVVRAQARKEQLLKQVFIVFLSHSLLIQYNNFCLY